MPSQHSIGRVDDTHLLTLPSKKSPTEHNTCEVRKLPPIQLMEAGIFDQLDALTGLVSEEMQELSGKAVPSNADGIAAIKVMSGKFGEIRKGLAVMDRVVELALVDPPVQRPVVRDEFGQPVLDEKGEEIPLPLNQRDPNVIYTDIVSQEDKNAILAFVMTGVEAVKPFRKGRKK